MKKDSLKVSIDLDCIPVWSHLLPITKPGYTDIIDIPLSVLCRRFSHIRLVVTRLKEEKA
jgi:hypothetical protein